MKPVRTLSRNLMLVCICLTALATLQCGRGEDRAYSRGSTTITVLDDSTLTYTSTVQDPLSDYRTYYPKHLLENLDPTEFWNWEFWKHPVGNGPYRYVRHVPKTMIELEANPDYYRVTLPPKVGTDTELHI